MAGLPTIKQVVDATRLLARHRWYRVRAVSPSSWPVTGDDVGERLFEGLRLGGIHQDLHFAILTTILQWSKEHGKELPEGFKMDARMWARREKLSNESVGLAVAIGVESGDERLIDILLKSNPRQKSREVVIGAGLALAAKLLVLSRKPMMEAIREAPELTASGYTVRRSVEHIGRNACAADFTGCQLFRAMACRSRSRSSVGGAPNILRYSRLNCDGLS